MASFDSKNIRFDEFRARGSQLVDKVREAIRDGNARRVTIRKNGRVLLEFPLSVGLGGAAAAVVFAPALAAVSAIAALVSDVDVVIERVVRAEIEPIDDEQGD